MTEDRSDVQGDADRKEDDSLQPEELSLKQLSEAYAQVLQEQDTATGEVADESVDIAIAEAEPVDDSESERRSPTKSLEEVDAADNAPCPISPTSIVEAILFAGAPAGVSLTGKKIAAAMRDVSPKEVKKSVKKLNEQYEKNNAAFRIVEQSGQYTMKLGDDLIEVQNYFFGRNRAARLSQSAIDVLAIVAYNQPVSRRQVDKIRSKPSGAVLNQLIRRDLIEFESAEKQKDGRYRTTNRFLNLFGLDSIQDLPQTSAVSDLEELTDY
jgi:segregation and condensation protein B